MNSREYSDPSGPSAPLLTNDDTSPELRNDDEAPPQFTYTEGWFIWILTFSAGISGLLFGYEYVSSPYCGTIPSNNPFTFSTGVISSTLVTIGTDLSNRPLDTLDESLITSCTSLFALIASPFTGIMADRYGRRKVILAADVLFALGALIQCSTSHVWLMIVGRSVVGLAVGSASAVTPL
ncbi:hypothetical protein N7488_003754 [Penicillium malachiteum]|nr:hypothetical protein N7488_003754 [Penicillium malachiteum]